MVNKKYTQKQIESTASILDSIFQVIKNYWLEIWSNLKDLRDVFAKNIVGWWLAKSIATLTVIWLIFIPMLLTYYNWFTNLSLYISNILYHEDKIIKIINDHNESVRAFFNIHNEKYWVDCDWHRWVNVDYNMANIRWTKTKPGKWCIKDSLVKIYPVSIWDLREDWKQNVMISWKAVFLKTEKDNTFKSVCYVDYNLWKNISWEKWYWKFNPFDNQECFPNKVRFEQEYYY